MALDRTGDLKPPNDKSLALIFHQLACIENAGLPLGSDVLLQAEKKPRIRKKIQRMAALLKSGHSLADSALNTELFRPVDLSVIKVGERGGKLGVVLQRLADYYEIRSGRASQFKKH